jgi:hypothetical protein
VVTGESGDSAVIIAGDPGVQVNCVTGEPCGHLVGPLLCHRGQLAARVDGLRVRRELVERLVTRWLRGTD